MGADLFISYAWTSDAHREWVHLLAANMKAIGYDVLIDADVDYGDGLNGFMRRATDCRHVLMVVDQNYVYRADHLPESGVGIENNWFRDAHSNKRRTWLSVLFRDNPGHLIPSWLTPHNPRGHSFNADSPTDSFPGSEQVEELWRWIEDLPANRDHGTRVATLRERCMRLEKIDRERDPNTWSSPAIEGEIDFDYERSPCKQYSLGGGEFSFALHVSGCDARSVYVLNDPIHAVGINRTGVSATSDLAAQLTPGRYVQAYVGQQVILQNSQGALCLVDLLDVQHELTEPHYKPASIQFHYRILIES